MGMLQGFAASKLHSFRASELQSFKASMLQSGSIIRIGKSLWIIPIE
jgi:hypothetical protein